MLLPPPVATVTGQAGLKTRSYERGAPHGPLRTGRLNAAPTTEADD
jgi:hypothetical protein